MGIGAKGGVEFVPPALLDRKIKLDPAGILLRLYGSVPGGRVIPIKSGYIFKLNFNLFLRHHPSSGN